MTWFTRVKNNFLRQPPFGKKFSTRSLLNSYLCLIYISVFDQSQDVYFFNKVYM